MSNSMANTPEQQQRKDDGLHVHLYMDGDAVAELLSNARRTTTTTSKTRVFSAAAGNRSSNNSSSSSSSARSFVSVLFSHLLIANLYMILAINGTTPKQWSHAHVHVTRITNVVVTQTSHHLSVFAQSTGQFVHRVRRDAEPFMATQKEIWLARSERWIASIKDAYVGTRIHHHVDRAIERSGTALVAAYHRLVKVVQIWYQVCCSNLSRLYSTLSARLTTTSK